jgi:hypothetical protein
LNKRVIALDHGKVVRDDARGGYVKWQPIHI